VACRQRPPSGPCHFWLDFHLTNQNLAILQGMLVEIAVTASPERPERTTPAQASFRQGSFCVLAGDNRGMPKTCSRCGLEKPLNEFYKQVGGAQGRRAERVRSVSRPLSGTCGLGTRGFKRADGRSSSGGEVRG
jgi:hypothetical protein